MTREYLKSKVIAQDGLRAIVDEKTHRSPHGLQMWRQMCREMFDSRELIGTLIWRDISVRYRQSVFGNLWAVLPPLITAAVFSFLVAQRAFPIGSTPIPHPTYAIWSIALWWLFAIFFFGRLQW